LIPRLGTQQTVGDIDIWEHWLPQQEIAQIVMLGTGTGVFSSILELLTTAPVFSYDIEDKTMGQIKLDHAILLDVLTFQQEIADILQHPGTSLLFCDNGDKPKEVELYSPYLKINDYLVVHDWGTEIFDVPQEFVQVDPYFYATVMFRRATG